MLLGFVALDYGTRKGPSCNGHLGLFIHFLIPESSGISAN